MKECNFTQTVDTYRQDILETPTQVLLDDEALDVLRLCGTMPCGAEAEADFSYFSALADCMPHLIGHPVRCRTSFFLKELFGIADELNPQSKNSIWSVCSEQLLQKNISRQWIEEFQNRQFSFCTLESLPCVDSLPHLREPIAFSEIMGTAPMFGITTWESWCAVASERLNPFWKGEAFALSMDLPEQFRFQKPDLYHVSKILAERSDLAEKDLWLAQELRFLCTELHKKEGLLHLRIHGNGSEVAKLISYLQISVPMPKMIWSCLKCSDFETMLEVQKKQTDVSICFAMRERELTVTDEERLLSAIAKRYPIGKLVVLTEGGTRNML